MLSLPTTKNCHAASQQHDQQQYTPQLPVLLAPSLLNAVSPHLTSTLFPYTFPQCSPTSSSPEHSAEPNKVLIIMQLYIHRGSVSSHPLAFCTPQIEVWIMQLYTHREDVDLGNAQQLAALPSQAVRYAAQDSGSSTDLLKTACPVSVPALAVCPALSMCPALWDCLLPASAPTAASIASYGGRKKIG